jgi:periplasmic divalent cation tolerance protein
VYRWQGKVEQADEWLLLIKTTESASAPVRDAITKLHSYEVPECIVVAIEDGTPAYLDWIGDSVKG